MALPHSITEQRRCARALRLAPSAATSARLGSVRLEASAPLAPRFAHGQPGCFRRPLRARELSCSRASPPSPTRATRP